MSPPPANEPSPPDNEAPRLLWFSTWRGVYLFVLGCFVVYVLLLALLSRAFA